MEDLPARDGPDSRPRIREQPEDFRVEEIPVYELSDEGGHTYLRVQKRLRSTEQVARMLARYAEVPAREVGYAGRKDRRAVTEQWFSVPGLDPRRALEIEQEGVEVLEARLHQHKLRPGHLSANRFSIVVRGIEGPSARAVGSELERLAETGFPNRFGRQRFGRDGRNADRGLRLMRGESRWKDRRTARLMVSALQSTIFNRVLLDRPWPLHQLQLGDVALIHESGGRFVVRDAELESRRAEAFEVSPTGPIFGRKMRRPEGEVAELESSVLRSFGLAEGDFGVPPFRLRGERRSLRARPGEVSWQELDEALQLKFTLPPGTYATVLLEELIPELEEVSHPPGEEE